MPDKRKVALYIRVAHKDDEAASMQESTLRRYAEDHGYADISAYVDNGVSGIGFDRPALNRLREDIEAGLVGMVIVQSISRVSRNHLEIPGLIDRIRRRGVSFTSVKDGITDEMFEKKDVLFQRYVDFLERQTNQPPQCTAADN